MTGGVIQYSRIFMLHSFLKDFKKHRRQYFILLSGLFLGAGGFFLFIGLPLLRITAVIFTGLFYFLWGMVHHLLNKDWHLKIALEYLLVAFIGCGLLLSIILRG